MSRGIIIFGANGVGKSTLGRALARALNFAYLEIEDYSFIESVIPYSKPRSIEESRKLLLADMTKHPSFVISAVTPDLGDEILSMLEFAILMSAPTEIRVKRVEHRAYEQFGERVREGGDLYEQESRFLNFIATRPVTKIEQWAKKLSCPVIPIDGTKDISENTEKIAEQYLSFIPAE
jgi:adenylate kinase family enzyme